MIRLQVNLTKVLNQITAKVIYTDPKFRQKVDLPPPPTSEKLKFYFGILLLNSLQRVIFHRNMGEILKNHLNFHRHFVFQNAHFTSFINFYEC